MVRQGQILLFLILTPFFSYAQLSLREVRQSMESAFASEGRFVLEVRQCKKYLYETDTTRINYSIYFDITTKPNYISIYQNDYQRYIIYDTANLAYSFDPSNKELKRITGSAENLLKNESSIPRFLNPTESDFVDFFFKDSVSRIIASNNADYIIRYVGRSNNGVKSGWIEMKVNKKSFLPLSMITFVELEDGEVQYESLLFNYNQTQKIKHEQIRDRIGKSKLLSKIAQPNANNYFVIDSNFQSLQVISEGKSVEIKTDTNRFILLDFWYVSCLPCIESIPQLNQLATRFPSQLKVYSINGFDKESTVKKFKYKHQFLSESFGIKSDNFKRMNIKSFPTFILIAPNGKIVLVQNGFNDNFYNEISNLINSYFLN